VEVSPAVNFLIVTTACFWKLWLRDELEFIGFQELSELLLVSLWESETSTGSLL